jgi:hypothetical protein
VARPDATAGAALEQNKRISPVYFVFMDFVGDPLRANTSGRDITLVGSGQPDLDGEYFGVRHNLVRISPVRMTSGGSQPVTAQLSGLPDIDDELLAGINDKSVWQGRTARLWQQIRNADRQQQGAIRHYYTGYMVNVVVRGEKGSQIVEMTIESYLASFSAPSGRTYLDAEEFDPGDMSARAAVAIANGVSGNPLINQTPTPGSGGAYDGGAGGGGRVRFANNMNLV